MIIEKPKTSIKIFGNYNLNHLNYKKNRKKSTDVSNKNSS